MKDFFYEASRRIFAPSLVLLTKQDNFSGIYHGAGAKF